MSGVKGILWVVYACICVKDDTFKKEQIEYTSHLFISVLLEKSILNGLKKAFINNQNNTLWFSNQIKMIQIILQHGRSTT